MAIARSRRRNRARLSRHELQSKVSRSRATTDRFREHGDVVHDDRVRKTFRRRDSEPHDVPAAVALSTARAAPSSTIVSGSFELLSVTSRPLTFVQPILHYVITMEFRTVAAREANRQFSALLTATEERGETIVITRRGKPVARLIPEPVETSESATKAARIHELLARFSRPMGGRAFVRESLYDDVSAESH